jgi:hypothetical protein
MESNRTVMIVLGAGLIILVPTVIFLLQPSDELMLPHPRLDSSDHFENDLGNAVKRSMGNFLWWYRTNIVLQFTLMAASLLAAVTAALTTSENAEMLKKYSVVFTAITAALATAQQTFHVRDNINSFVTSTTRLELLVYDYLSRRNGLSKNGNSDSSPELLNIQQNIMKTYVDIEANRMRAWASIGEQVTQPKDLRATEPNREPRSVGSPTAEH